jgi:hypothetical protein
MVISGIPGRNSSEKLMIHIKALHRELALPKWIELRRPPVKRIVMRQNVVQTLAAWCLGRGCNHQHTIDVSAHPGDGPV